MSDPRTAVVQDYGDGHSQNHITAGPAQLAGDLTEELGGLDCGPTPHDLVAASLAECTVQTLRLYAQRKGWALGPIRVEVANWTDATAAKPEQFRRTVFLPEGIDEEQRTRLIAIANHCPIHRLLEPGATIETVVG